ncbi:hypothetical protein Hgul01_03013 [Herpetosiphon gulosus]|uniref:Uncharacterized protein n=1 Tax=Herpetosiphon gulosus TaxID=1973496 RepID=A0ABP9X193_9CHLR
MESKHFHGGTCVLQATLLQVLETALRPTIGLSFVIPQLRLG